MVIRGAGKDRAQTFRRLVRWRPTRRQLQFFLLGFAGFIFVVTLAQLFYPTGRLLPLVRINGERLGGQTTWDATQHLEKAYENASVEVRGGEVTAHASFAEVGLDPAITQTVVRASSYSLKQRLIPFSSVAIMFKRNQPLELQVDAERVQYFAEQFEKESLRPAVNASIAVEGDQIKLIPAKPSQQYPAAAVYAAILAAPRSPHMIITPQVVSEQAAITDAQAQETQNLAQTIVDAPLQVQVGETTITVEKAVVASWLEFPIKEGKMELSVKTDAVRQYIESIQPQGYQAPRATRITTVDGRETGRVSGVAGRGVDVNAAVVQLEERIKSKQGGTLALPMITLPAGLTYDRQYSGGSAGLLAYLVDLVNSKGNYAITVIELGGKQRGASVNGDKVYIAASTYKVFVAYAAFELARSGELSWNESVGGQTAAGCFEAMIVRSDNNCAWAMGQRVGWSRVQNLIQAAGLYSTTLSADGAEKYTTANDLALFMRKLEEGTLLPQADRDLLISYLKRQVYRNGIPAATGVPVANKVGRYGNYVHDAGIVYSPSGTYIMVIMSYGTWSGLTTTARQVHQFVIK